MLNEKQINEFIKIVSGDLQISTTIIEYIDTFDSVTQFADVNLQSRLIRLKREVENGLDQFFAIAHELRHLYQNDHGLLTDDYSFDKSDIISYNTQEAELDANAYAGCVMIEHFGVKPLFSGFDENTKKLIYKRINEMYIKRNKMQLKKEL